MRWREAQSTHRMRRPDDTRKPRTPLPYEVAYATCGKREVVACKGNCSFCMSVYEEAQQNLMITYVYYGMADKEDGGGISVVTVMVQQCEGAG